LGSTSFAHIRETELAPRQTSEFLCCHGHRFPVTFAQDVDVPSMWDCRFDGSPARLVGAPDDLHQTGKARRTHFDMLLERRSLEDLQDLLDERLAVARARRGRGAAEGDA
jgi:hypothetical protein